MRKRIFSMILALAMIVCLLPAAAFNVVAEDSEITIDFTAKGYANNTAVTKVTEGPVTVEFDKGTNSNAPKYYTSGTAIRAYGGNYFTVSVASGKITKIEITFGSGDGSNAITTDVDTYDAGTWTGEAVSVNFTIGGSSGNRRLQSFKVTVSSDDGGDEPGPDEPDPDDCKHEWDEGVVTQEPTCTEKGIRTCTCLICEEERDFDIDPLGHDLEYYETVDPTCAENGYDLYICLREGCDYSEHRDETPKGAHNFTKGVCEVCGTKIYVQVTSDGELEGTGTYLIVCKTKNMIAAEHNSSNYYNNEGITFTGSAIVGEYSAYEFTITDCGGKGHTISRDGQYMYHSGKNLAYESPDVKYNIIAIDANGNATITNDGYYLQYNARSPRFSYYTSNQTAIQIYKIHDEHSYDENSTCTVCGYQNGVLAGGDLGDINGDDVVDIVDAQLLADYLADNLDEDAIDADWFECFDIVADLDENGKISVYDLSLMLAYLYE